MIKSGYAGRSSPQNEYVIHPMSEAPYRPVESGDRILLVDGSGYTYRAYHALPPIKRKSDGLQLNAVIGFCSMLWKLLCEIEPEEKPTHLAIIFDKSKRTFR